MTQPVVTVPLSKREDFARSALNGLLAIAQSPNNHHLPTALIKEICTLAVAYADGLIAALG